MSMQGKIAPQKSVTEQSDVVWLHYSDLCRPDSQQCLCSLAVPFIQSLIWIDSGFVFLLYFFLWNESTEHERGNPSIYKQHREVQAKLKVQLKSRLFQSSLSSKNWIYHLMLLLRDVWSLLDDSIWFITVNLSLLFAWSACKAFTRPCWRKDITVSLLNRISAGWLHHRAV